MGQKLQLKGKQFGRLTVVADSGQRCKAKCVIWECLCDCGNKCFVRSRDLKSGHTQSCGCLHKERAARYGEDHWNWQGGITDPDNRVRHFAEYSEWRIKVFERDNYTCQKCLRRGGTLRAHHIESFHDNVKLRTALENGVTLCEDCHKNFHHRYGYICSKEQLTEFTEGQETCKRIIGQ